MGSVKQTISPSGETPEEYARGELKQKQTIAHLQELMGEIEDKYQETDIEEIPIDNEKKEGRVEALRGVFDFFESQGVDYNNPKAVQAFLEKTEKNDKEAYQRIVVALEIILGEKVGMNADAFMGNNDSNKNPFPLGAKISWAIFIIILILIAYMLGKGGDKKLTSQEMQEESANCYKWTGKDCQPYSAD